jgi:hypothetical protein
MIMGGKCVGIYKTTPSLQHLLPSQIPFTKSTPDPPLLIF